MKTNNTIKISNGNSKVGRIPNMSLTPGKTCSAEACKTCLCGGCYAMKSYRMYSNVRNAWDSNTEMAVNNLEEMERQLAKYFAGMNAPRFFRLHVAGDFVSREYTMMWARIAAAAPHTNFLAFTKQWDNIRGIDFPSNFSLVLSAWPGTVIPADLREKYSVAWLDDGTEQIPENAMECPGNCETCGACWGLARMGIDVKFAKH
jgi:hypothetical protein